MLMWEGYIHPCSRFTLSSVLRVYSWKFSRTIYIARHQLHTGKLLNPLLTPTHHSPSFLVVCFGPHLAVLRAFLLALWSLLIVLGGLYMVPEIEPGPPHSRQSPQGNFLTPVLPCQPSSVFSSIHTFHRCLNSFKWSHCLFSQGPSFLKAFSWFQSRLFFRVAPLFCRPVYLTFPHLAYPSLLYPFIISHMRAGIWLFFSFQMPTNAFILSLYSANLLAVGRQVENVPLAVQGGWAL